MPSATLKIFLPFGDPKRLRTSELSNWTGKAVAGPRSELEKILEREESANSGVYFLTGIDTDCCSSQTGSLPPELNFQRTAHGFLSGVVDEGIHKFENIIQDFYFSA